jgi:xanthine dehydrogenase YagR molybdenum-binding subunit
VTTTDSIVGTSVGRIEGVHKVTGQARYAAEFPLGELAYGWIVPSRIARGRISSIDVDAALAMPGVLAVLHHGNARKLTAPGDRSMMFDPSIMLLQEDRVHHYGELVAVVVATTSEQARAAAEALPVKYDTEPHDVVLTAGHPKLYQPEVVNANYPAVTDKGDVDTALATAEIVVDAVYTIPAEQNTPMEPNAATAQWDGGQLTVFDSNQGAFLSQQVLASLLGIEPGAVRVLSEHVGGGFGAKGGVKAQLVLAAMAAEAVGRPVRVTLTRQQMFYLVGYRTPTIQRVRLGAGRDGRLTALDHVAYSQTSTIHEFTEQTAVMSRMMYAADSLRTRHEVAPLDVPTPRWMRAPGEAPGSFALESAMDELAEASGVDPIELRARNEPTVEPASGRGFGSRDLLGCYREGARLFGWGDRDPRPGSRRDGRWLIGTGVASATYPARNVPSTASVTAEPDGGYTVRITASDIGTGARTVLSQIAADELRVPIGEVRVLIGNSDYGPAMLAGGSLGTASWSWAIVKACRALRAELPLDGNLPDDGLTVSAGTNEDVSAVPDLVRHSYGAQFAEVAVDLETGEIRVPRLLGYFDVGRVINPITARSQLIGGMIMGLSMALMEKSTMDEETGDFVNHDLAGYYVAANADVRSVEVGWLDQPDDVHPSGVKGLGEVGIVGTAAAIANAIWHATGVRHRDLPMTPAQTLRRIP